MSLATLWRWLALLAAVCALVLSAAGPVAAAAATPEGDDNHEEYNEADGAFLGGPDPPCAFPCMLVMLALFVAALVAGLVLGLALAGVILAVAAVVGAVCLGLAAWFAWQGMWLAAVAAFLPVILTVWAIVAKRRTKCKRDDSAAGRKM